MSLGRTRGAFVLGFVVLVGSTALAAGPAFARQHLIRGKMRTDGLLTVGQQETVSLRNLPPKSSLGIQIRPAGECFSPEQNGLCLPEPAYPVPGTPKFKTTGKGRARLTFVMPSGNLFLDFSDPLQSHPISFANGQVVRVEALGIEFTGRLQFSKASTSAAVEVPPSP